VSGINVLLQLAWRGRSPLSSLRPRTSTGSPPLSALPLIAGHVVVAHCSQDRWSRPSHDSRYHRLRHALAHSFPCECDLLPRELWHASCVLALCLRLCDALCLSCEHHLSLELVDCSEYGEHDVGVHVVLASRFELQVLAAELDAHALLK